MRNINAITMMDLYKDNHSRTNIKAKNCKIFKIKFDARSTLKNRFIFYVKCFEKYSKSSGWIVSIVYQNIDHDKQRNQKKPLNTDVRVKCTCPAFLYWGSAYNATDGDYNWNFSEDREPNIRDPFRQRKICKHLSHVRTKLRNKTFKQMRKQYGAVALETHEEEIPEIEWYETIPSIEKYLLSIGMSKRDVKKLISIITYENYIEFLEKYEIIIGDYHEDYQRFCEY